MAHDGEPYVPTTRVLVYYYRIFKHASSSLSVALEPAVII